MAAAFIIAFLLPACGERADVKRIISKERKAKVVWLREDSCYSVTRPLLSARNKAAKATRFGCELAHADLNRLSDQMNDRYTDHGGLKVKCYIVGFTYGGSHIDSTLVMVEPSGELVTELQETESWLEASGEIGKISNFVFYK